MADREVIGADRYSHSIEHHDNPEQIAIRREIRDILENAIETLPDIYQTVFRMREVDGYNVEETASNLNLTLVNVKVRLSRAKGILRDMLKKQRLDEDLKTQGWYA